MGDQRHQ